MLADAAARITQSLKAPTWLVDEVQHRLVLFLNHVLMQEPEAQVRLTRQKGRVVRVQWGEFHMQLMATPAGLCELAPAAVPDLRLTVTDGPLSLAKTALKGDKPAVQIEGDVQFAAEVNWLVDHVRWDAEEDLTRVVGDVAAHQIATAARGAAQALRRFVGGSADKGKAGA